ncbi:hypothetical protein [Nocardia sp. NBC_01009]|uniref:hypothetical protein n=1 Tax=unclassified Nocardia TaxID=2637762 RepID=UPI00386708D2|nr:DUF3482 domain-containing protein [Nocardia sp. NBC_01009]
MRTITRLAVTVVGALVAIALTIGFASTASAAPAESTDPIAAASEPTPHATEIEKCLLMGDTIEIRTAVGAAIGAVLGGIVGLPLFFIGAIPGAIIGGLLGVFIGSTSYAIDAAHLQQQGLC